MRLAYTRYSGERGYTPQQFREVVEEVAGIDMGPWFANAVDSAEPLELEEPLAWFGLTYKATSHDEEGWTGCSLGGGNRVSSLDERGPGWASGLQIGDEVLAVDRRRVHSSDWAALGTRHKPGDTVTVLASRRGQLREVTLVLGTAPVTRSVEINAQAEEAAHKRRGAWLNP